MKRNRLLDNFVVRNLLGLLALLGVHYLADQYAMDQRSGFSKVSPYLYLLLLYGWLIFHNRILFERLFLQGRKGVYFGWLLLLMVLGSFNMNFILHTEFNIAHSLPYLVNFWVYTVTGLGVYIAYRYLHTHQQTESPSPPKPPVLANDSGSFTCIVDGERKTILYADIQYIESLENYLKIIAKPKVFVTRLTMKEAEERLPKRQFVRISRSCIVNVMHITSRGPDSVWIGTDELRIGKVYKRYVAEQFADE
ncbi:LytR/AlgR family response regulator transcription factor [Spirosoma endophyticum]|uniref:LytTr DNA-binding domain-containing protein n=1 Tax=Spirosoma endophyticum TaxID=662367 RepID=A0A1I1QWM1_9BACT|nr:LytTR family DNA-binding domain-containing protein [Spirosoma endophyticum]SFD23673.1 LytTr DNA-binding domain-containing protein [Spirosoma endophyticum]